MCEHIINLISDQTDEIYMKFLHKIFVNITYIKSIHTEKKICKVLLSDIITKFKKLTIKKKLTTNLLNDLDVFKGILYILKDKNDKITFLQMTYITYHDRAISYSMDLIMRYIAKKIDGVEDDKILYFY